MFKLFRGDFKRDLDSADFIASSDKSILHMKYVIMQSIRMAFHYAQEAFIMGEFDVPANEELEVRFLFLICFRRSLLPSRKSGS